MRVSAKVDYALRAVAQVASEGEEPIKAEHIARAQEIPLSFLLGILRELTRGRVLRSHRGTDGGYQLARPAEQISLAEVMRIIDGPLVNLHESSVHDLGYGGASEALEEVWMAVRSSVRSVLEGVTVADLVSGTLPAEVRELAQTYLDGELSRLGVRRSSVAEEKPASI